MGSSKEIKQPVAAGERVRLTIADLNHDGEGVGKVDGFTVFVPGAAPGDRLEVKVISLQKNYARALPLAIEHEAACRTVPLCAAHGSCGGCQLQHIRYATQLRLKQKIVGEALHRIGGLDVPVLPVLGMADPWRYRNKVQVAVAAAANGSVCAGFYEKRSHRVVDLAECPVQHPAGDRATGAVRAALQELGISAYDEASGRGAVRHIVARVSFDTAEVLLVLVTNGRALPQAERLVEQLRESIEGLAGIVQNVNTRPGNVILGGEDITLWGRPYLVDKIGGLSFRVSARSFFQVNPVQTEALYRQVRRYAGLTGEETVFDLYCGIGTISLYLAGEARRVIGVETVGAAVKDARRNAAANGTTNAQFYAGKAETVAAELAAKGCRADVVVVDPPRKGCDRRLLDTIAAMGPSRVVYVSCNPATLARDLKILSEKGFRAALVQPVDMFPHTSHVECVVLITKVEK